MTFLWMSRLVMLNLHHMNFTHRQPKCTTLCIYYHVSSKYNVVLTDPGDTSQNYNKLPESDLLLATLT